MHQHTVQVDEQNNTTEEFQRNDFNVFSRFPWKQMSRRSVYLILLLIPLFFFPNLSNVLDFPKQLLLFFLSFLGVFFWFLEGVGRGELSFKTHHGIYGFLILLLFGWGISTNFSYSRYGSFWGWPLQVSESFFTLLSFALFFFLVHQLFSKKEEMLFLILILLGSAGLVSLFGLFQLWGKFLLPFDFARTSSFHTVGSPTSLAVFSAALLPVAARILFAFSLRGIRLVIPSFAASASLLTLVWVNSSIAWIVLFGAGGFLLFISIFFERTKSYALGMLLTSFFFVLIASFFLILGNPFFQRISSFPPEIYPSVRATLQINGDAWSERPIVGTGPGTFRFNYTKFRDPALNNTIFWATRFGSGSSKILDSVGTTGLLGAGALLAFIASLIFFSFSRLFRVHAEERMEWSFFSTIVVGIVGSVEALLFSWNTISLFLVFWFFAALLTILSHDPKRIYRFKFFSGGEGEKEDRTLSWTPIFISFLFVLFSLMGVVLVYFSLMRFSADFSYEAALQEFSHGNLQEASDLIARAVKKDPLQALYWGKKAEIDFALLRQELERGSVTEEDFRKMLIDAVEAAKRATEIEPKDSLQWLKRAFLYQQLIGVVGGAEDAALKWGYLKAKELDPADPYVSAQVGRVYIQKAVLDQQRGNSAAASEDLKMAEDYLNQALVLKKDFAPAHFQLAVIAQLRGNTEGAIQKLEQIKSMGRLDAGLSFQLGVLYYHAQQFDKAKRELENAVALNPDYSNARYMLGLIYEKEGRRDLAIDQFLKIEKLNPDNQEVKKILNNLRSQRPALEGISQEQPPQTPLLEGLPKTR